MFTTLLLRVYYSDTSVIYKFTFSLRYVETYQQITLTQVHCYLSVINLIWRFPQETTTDRRVDVTSTNPQRSQVSKRRRRRLFLDKFLSYFFCLSNKVPYIQLGSLIVYYCFFLLLFPAYDLYVMMCHSTWFYCYVINLYNCNILFNLLLS